jgi:hypothetical protein
VKVISGSDLTLEQSDFTETPARTLSITLEEPTISEVPESITPWKAEASTVVLPVLIDLRLTDQYFLSVTLCF